MRDREEKLMYGSGYTSSEFKQIVETGTSAQDLSSITKSVPHCVALLIQIYVSFNTNDILNRIINI